MRRFCWSGLALVVLVAAPAMVRAGEKEFKAPVITVRLRSLETVDRGLAMLSRFSSFHNANHWFGPSHHKVALKEFKGWDLKRPLGFYIFGGEQLERGTSPVVFVFPVTDEKQFLETLPHFDMKTTPGDDDHLYRVQCKEFSGKGDLRFAYGYAYLALGGPGHVARDRLLPPKLLFPKGQKAAVTFQVRLDRIPEKARQNLIAFFGRPAQTETDETIPKTSPRENAKQQIAKVFREEANRILLTWLRDGKDLTAEFDINAKQHELAIDVALMPKAHTRLAETIDQLGKTTSKFPGLFKSDAALAGIVSLTLSDKLRTGLNGVLEEVAKKARAELKEADQKQELADLILAMAPAISTHKVQGAVLLRGPNAADHYTLVLARSLKNPEKVKKTVAALLNALPEAEKAKIKYDVDKVGSVAIHRLDLQKSLPKECRDLFGNQPIYVAFRPDAFFLAMGDEGLSSLKEALLSPAGPGTPLKFEVSVRRLAALASRNDKNLQREVEKVFSPGEEGKICFTVEGGETLHLRLHMDLDTLRAFARLWGYQPPSAPSEKKETGVSKK